MSIKILKGVAAGATLAWAASAIAQEPPTMPEYSAAKGPLLVSADMRHGTDLGGEWHYSIDPYRAGITGFHGGEADSANQRYRDIDVAKEMSAKPRLLYEFDLARSPVTKLPSSWLTAAPELRHYQGAMWYQRSVPVQRGTGKRYFLRFGAANYITRVYLNGKPVGRHEGGFTPFAFDVTKFLRDGDNNLVIAVDAQATDSSVPPPVTDWENYGGVTRSIRLISTPETYVDDAWVRLTRDGKIAVDARLDGPEAANQVVRLSVPGLGLTLNGKTDASGNWRATAIAPRALVHWSPEKPQLYDVSIVAGKDQWRDRIGFRTIEVRGPDILLNGKPVFLRGISMHEEEIAAKPTRNITREAARELLTTIKSGLNGNYVRLAHYPHSEEMTRMADELGLLVWSEIPVYWRVDWSNSGTLAVARNMLAENILRDRNRAAIAIWSVANETPVSDARNHFLQTLVSDVRAMDDTRLVSSALLVRRENDANGIGQMTMIDPMAKLFDVLAINTYNGWYGSDPLANVPLAKWNVPADKPLVLSEFGAEALTGYHDMAAEPHKFSEEYQAEYYRRTLEMADKIPTLRGMTPWILKDFQSPRRQHPIYQQGWNRKGVISETGERKLAFDVLAQYYRAKAGE